MEIHGNPNSCGFQCCRPFALHIPAARTLHFEDMISAEWRDDPTSPCETKFFSIFFSGDVSFCHAFSENVFVFLLPVVRARIY